MSKVHTVSQGECLSLIARNYGFDNWRTIYDDAANADFRRLRPNPNLIYPGDKVVIPDLVTGKEGAGTEKTHTFELKLDHTMLRIVVKDALDKAIASKDYRLTVPPLLPMEGKTGGDGMIEHEIPQDGAAGTLEVFLHGKSEPPLIWRLHIGGLDPIQEVDGYQARLNNLAYDCGPVDGIDGPLTKAGVRRFQTAEHIQVDGVVGPQTRGTLEKAYGC